MQLQLLKAIALEGRVAQPQAHEFLQKYELPSASSIRKSLDVLKEKELVYKSQDGLMVYDRFLNLWLKRTFYR
jgi:hypothetical protein